MWSILENVPCALGKKVYSFAFGWNVLKISMKSISSNISFKTCISLLVFCFDNLPIDVIQYHYNQMFLSVAHNCAYTTKTFRFCNHFHIFCTAMSETAHKYYNYKHVLYLYSLTISIIILLYLIISPLKAYINMMLESDIVR